VLILFYRWEKPRDHVALGSRQAPARLRSLLGSQFIPPHPTSLFVWGKNLAPFSVSTNSALLWTQKIHPAFRASEKSKSFFARNAPRNLAPLSVWMVPALPVATRAMQGMAVLIVATVRTSP
jgi:hypothetical protein